MAFAIVLRRLLATALQRSGRHRLGPADTVTLARAVLIGGVTAMAADSLTRPVDVPVLVTLTVIALLLDAVDGQVARRSRTASAFGARFDMEVDAFLLLVLSLLLVEPLGWWALAVGAMRYGFVALGLALPWLTAGLPPRFSRKVVAAVQGVVLVVAVAGVLPQGAAAAAVGAALAALCWSFGLDARWLYRVRVVIRTR
jgi:phosphatidylglycerophosphate synthase